jgi:hypothetical protein
MSKFLKILLVCVICCQFGFIGAVGLGGGTGGDVVPVARTTGLQTNMVELARFDALWDAAGQTGDINTDRQAVLDDGTAVASGNWVYAFNLHPTWEGDQLTGRCEPTNAGDPTQAGYDTFYNFEKASADILALAMAGALEQEAGDTATANEYFASAKASLMDYIIVMGGFSRTRAVDRTTITDPDISDNNPCILALGTAVPNFLEAAWLMEDAGYAPWTAADRLTLAQWARDEAFYLVSWGVQSNKDHWGIVTFNAALAIAAYGEGVEGFDNVTEWNGVTAGDTRTPTQYLNLADERLSVWLDNSANPLDSSVFVSGVRGCFGNGQRFGLQSYGAFPDELRQTGGTNNCNQEDLSFLCGPGQAECSAGNDAKFYQQKATNGLAHTCEILRRVDGNGARCFDIATHDANPASREALYDAALFSTTERTSPSGTTAGIFQDYAVSEFAQGFKYVASTYYDDICMYGAYDETSTNVRGGRDYPYTRVTHREGVAYASSLTIQPTWDCATWDGNDWGA